MITNFEIKDLIKHLLGEYDLKEYLTPVNMQSTIQDSMKRTIPRVDNTLLYMIQA